MAENRHQIKRQVLELVLPDEENVREKQDDFLRLYYERLVPVIEKCLDEYADADTFVRIDRLELNLGSFDPDLPEGAFSKALEAAVREKLPSILRGMSSEDGFAEQGEIIDHIGNRLEALIFFLYSGQMPWWAQGNPDFAPSALLEHVLAGQPGALVARLRRELERPVVVRRLAWQYTTAQKQRLLRLLLPAAADILLELREDFVRLHVARAFSPLFSAEFERHTWEAAFATVPDLVVVASAVPERIVPVLVDRLLPENIFEPLETVFLLYRSALYRLRDLPDWSASVLAQYIIGRARKQADALAATGWLADLDGILTTLRRAAPATAAEHLVDAEKTALPEAESRKTEVAEMREMAEEVAPTAPEEASDEDDPKAGIEAEIIEHGDSETLEDHPPETDREAVAETESKEDRIKDSRPEETLLPDVPATSEDVPTEDMEAALEDIRSTEAASLTESETIEALPEADSMDEDTVRAESEPEDPAVEPESMDKPDIKTESELLSTDSDRPEVAAEAETQVADPPASGDGDTEGDASREAAPDGKVEPPRKDSPADDPTSVSAEPTPDPDPIKERFRKFRQMLQENPEALYPDPKKERLSIPWKEDAHGTMIANAGLVLLHPFLYNFYKALGLAQDKQFVDEAARFRAVHLLHYLATGEHEAASEDRLTICKIMTGLHPNDPVPGDVVLSKPEMAEGDMLLRTVVSYWTILKKTSIDGLRNAFLKREGLLRDDEQGWMITIQRDTQDVLLDRIPWGYGTLRMSWSPKMIFVEW